MLSHPFPATPQQAPDSRRHAWNLVLTCCLGVALGACSPTFNWRELRPEGSPLQALMPCKPEVAQRPVPLGGASTSPTTLHMYSCDTGGITFAVSWADVGEPGRTDAALALLRRASLAAVRVNPVQVDEPALQWSPRIAGVPNARGLKAQGTQHEQRAVQMQAVHFASGRLVYQAAVYGPALTDEMVTPFFEGLRLP